MILTLLLDETAILGWAAFIIGGPIALLVLALVYNLTKAGTSRNSRIFGAITALIFWGMGSMVPLDGLAVLLFLVFCYTLFRVADTKDTMS